MYPQPSHYTASALWMMTMKKKEEKKNKKKKKEECFWKQGGPSLIPPNFKSVHRDVDVQPRGVNTNASR